MRTINGSKIAITTLPLPDELLATYMVRIAKLNIFSLAQLNSFLDYGTGQARNSMQRFDSMHYVGRLLKSINNVDPIELFFKTSIYNALSPFIEEEERSFYLGHALSDFSFYKDLFRSSRKSYIGALKLCPECQKEDIENYGEYYYHRSHQLNGVDVCYKHKTPLYKLDWKYGLTEDDIFLGGALEEGKYGDFREIQINEKDLEFQIELAGLINILLNPFGEEKEKWLKKMEADENADELLLKARHLISGASKGAIEPCKKRIIHYLRYGKYPFERIDFLKGDDDYSIIQSLGDDIYLCKCKWCGANFVSTRLNLSFGWSCPCQRKDVKLGDIIKGISRTKYDGRFSSPSFHRGSSGMMVMLYDNKVSNLLLIRPYTLLYKGPEGLRNYGVMYGGSEEAEYPYTSMYDLPYSLRLDKSEYEYTCNICKKSFKRSYREGYIPECYSCRRDRQLEKVKNDFKRYKKELKIKKFVKGNSRYLSFTHKTCGTTFEKSLYSIEDYNYVMCKGCKKKFYRDDYYSEKEEIIKEKAKKVKDRYGGLIKMTEIKDIEPMEVEFESVLCGHHFTRNENGLERMMENKSCICSVCRKRIHIV